MSNTKTSLVDEDSMLEDTESQGKVAQYLYHIISNL